MDKVNSAAEAAELVILKNALESIMDEMTFTMVRTAQSTSLREAMDFSTAFCDPAGRILVQGLTLPLHLGGLEEAVRLVADLKGADARPGDVLVLNDPYGGGTHLPDLFTISPIFLKDELVGYLSTVAHHSDVGGRMPGSNASDSTEIYQEGLRIPLNYLYRAGKANETLFSIISANVRHPDRLFLADLRAQLAAAHVGAARFLQLAKKMGWETLRRQLDRQLDYSESRTREALRAMPAGEYHFTDYIDDDGIDDSPIPIRVAVRIGGGELEADFTGSSPQVRGAINCTYSFTKSAVYLVVASLIDADIPKNAGFFRPIRVVAPLGTVVNLKLPAACAARAITGFRAADAVYGAMAQALPHRVFAAGDGGNLWATFAGEKDDGGSFVFVDSVVGAWGARPTKDGLEGNSPIALNIRNQSVEAIEATYPIRIEQYGFVPDSGGAGKYRGGLGLVRDYRLLAPGAVLQVRSDRKRVLPYGLSGGDPGSPSNNSLISGDSEEELPSKFNRTLRRGDLFRHVSPGGGGFGDPLDRDPAHVARDVRGGYISKANARRRYGVVFRRESDQIDARATSTLRRQVRAAGAERPDKRSR